MVSLLRRIPIPRFSAYVIFSSILFSSALWRASNKVHIPTSTGDGSSENSQSDSFEHLMQDSYFVAGVFNTILCLIVVSGKLFQFFFFSVNFLLMNPNI